MKRGNLWATVMGAGLVMVGITGGRAAMQTPTMLYLAGQFQVANGHPEEGLRLINQAANTREPGTVHAAEPEPKPVEVCTQAQPKTTQVKPTVSAKPVYATAKFNPAMKKAAPVALIAKLELPVPPMAPSAFPPTAFRYLDDQQRAESIRAQAEIQRAQVEKMKHLRHSTLAVIEKYAPTAMGFDPVDLSNFTPPVPSAVGQTAN